MRRQAEALVVAVVLGVLAACGAAALPRPRPPADGRDAATDANGAEAGPGDAASEPAAGDAAALGALLAPGMRLVERTKLDADGGGYVLEPSDADRCYRIALLTSALVDATLTDDGGHVLASARGASPVLGAKGPVCLRRGHRATVTVGAGAAGELLVWTAP